MPLDERIGLLPSTKYLEADRRTLADSCLAKGRLHAFGGV